MTAVVLENILEKARLWRQENKPFVLYAKPIGTGLTAMFQLDAELHRADDFSESGFVFASFDGEKRWLIPDGKAEIFSASAPGDGHSSREIAVTPRDEKAKSDFEELVAKGIKAIESGKFGKVVLSRKESVAISPDFTEIYTRLLAAYPSAFRYCWFHPETGIWMGATPERLLKSKNNEFQTVALAGTQPFVDTEHVIWQEKEKAEQQFVTDFIAQGLKKLTSKLIQSGPYTARAGNLLHIKTDISGDFASGPAIQDAVEMLHPTPAVCGYPKAAAKEFILKSEGYDREFYSGFLGEIGPEECDLYVNLRCMKVGEKSANLYVGCGITKDSDPEKEFIETANKALTMKKILI